MIEKIIKVQGIGLLHDALPGGAVELGRVVAVYAENGKGKTTWSTICQSLACGDGHLIVQRATLGGNLNPSVELLLDGTCYRFLQGRWDAACTSVVVFDSGFIDRNVYSGCRVAPEHRENLLEFALGEEGVNLKSDIDEIASAIQIINGRIRTKQEVVKAYAGPYSVDEFLALRQTPDIDARIAKADADIRAARDAQNVAKRPELERVLLPELPLADIQAILTETLDSVAERAERMVREHISSHMGEQAEAWLESGLLHARTDTCPFCGQNMRTADLVTAYREYFSEAYKNLKQRVADTKADLETRLSEDALADVVGAIARNEAVHLAWADQPAVVFPAPPSRVAVAGAWRAAKSVLAAALDMKAAEPLARSQIMPAAQESVREYNTVRQQCDDYSGLLDQINRELRNVKQRASTANMESLERELDMFAACRKRFDPTVAAECALLTGLAGEKRQKEDEKAHKRASLDEFTARMMTAFKDAMNAWLLALRAEFSIVEVKASYAGGRPRSDYKIKLRGAVVPLSSGTRTATSQDFSNTLSDGDRRTLALSLFLARLQTDPSIATRTIVVDDPVSSFDIHRRRATLEALLDVGAHASQLMVLSHNAEFLRDFAARARDSLGDCQVLQIRRQATASIFDGCDINAICESEYYGNYRALTSYCTEGCGGSLRPVAKAIRPYLERNLRERFPLEFGSDERLGRMISRVRESQPGNPLHFLRPKLKDIEDLNDYASKFHHDSNARADAEHVTDAELKPFVELALRIGWGTS